MGLVCHNTRCTLMQAEWLCVVDIATACQDGILSDPLMAPTDGSADNSVTRLTVCLQLCNQLSAFASLRNLLLLVTRAGTLCRMPCKQNAICGVTVICQLTAESTTW